MNFDEFFKLIASAFQAALNELEVPKADFGGVDYIMSWPQQILDMLFGLLRTLISLIFGGIFDLLRGILEFLNQRVE